MTKHEHVDRIEQRPFDLLEPNPRNPRLHPPEQVARIARSIQAFGFNNPILARGSVIVAGHGRWQAAAELGLETVPVIDLSHLSEAEAHAYLLADNKAQDGADTDTAAEAAMLAELYEAEFDVSVIGYSEDEIAEALRAAEGPGDAGPGQGGDPDAGARAEPPAEPRIKAGEVWQLGRHRLVCGDSTDPAVVRVACGDYFGSVALIHADPPYGMGKESEGVANDNLYREKLDEFQTAWLAACRPAAVFNASLFVWGNAEDLWRWWFGLELNEPAVVKNEVVWDKGSVPGMASPFECSYPTATERALFAMFGEQFLGNMNTEQYWEGFDPIRLWVASEMAKNEWTRADVNRITETQMAGHWVSRSQFQIIGRHHFDKLAGAAEAADLPGFRLTYDEFLDTVATEDVKSGGRAHARDLAAEFRDANRSYFDNAHEIMTDVWRFPRVHGEERHGHPTPKPVAMIERVIRSSCPAAGVVLEPFGGSGATLIAAERTGRACAIIELQPAWCDVIVDRWEQHTGQTATRDAGAEMVTGHDTEQSDGGES